MMEGKADTRLELLITIVDYSLRKVLRDLYKRIKLPFYLQSQGYGSAESEIYDLLGFGSPKKIFAISIQNATTARRILAALYGRIGFDQPGTGIAFTISLSSVTSSLWKISNQACDLDQIKTEKEALPMELKEPYDLVVAIVNRGHSELVMEAAKGAGATGGTLLHALGLGSKEAEKFLGIAIQSEKDVILILTPRENKAAIMEQIAHEAGMHTAGKGICFSLPVNTALGLEPRLELE
ncbi:MAG TPA: hypothetical protein DD734_07195 [Firmicutes bacterium]|nr:hypothetical protein [Bacillota bacterium]